MTDTEQTNEQPKLITDRERLINYGDYEHEKFSVADMVIPVDMVPAQFVLCAKLNAIELNARENHAKVKEQWRKLEIARLETEQKETEKEERDLRNKILQALRQSPNLNMSELAEAVDVTENRLRMNLGILQDEGKIKPRTCPRLFDVVANPQPIEAREESDEEFDIEEETD